MEPEEFYFDGTRIDGYFGIRNQNENIDIIWIDCPKEYIKVIVDALNSKAGKKNK